MGRKPIHGYRGSKMQPVYLVWKSMKARCLYPSQRSYKYYGARGIRVCERWSSSFVDFLADMGDRPTPRHWIERIDNDGDYEPGNCKWALPEESVRNRRQNGTALA